MGKSNLSKVDVERMEAKKDTDGLIRALNCIEDWRVRDAAAETLGKIGDASAVEPLIQALLNDDKYGVRRTAAKALGKIKDVRAVNPLVQELKTLCFWIQKFPKCRRRELYPKEVVEALGEFGESAVEPLVQALRDNDSYVRRGAVEALEKIGWQPKNAIELAYYLIANRAWDKIAEVGEPAIEPLIQRLKDNYFQIRDKAVWTLGKIGKPAVQPLIQALKDENWRVRWGAARALGEIEDKRAVKPLEQVASDANGEVRIAAAISLGKIKKEKEMESLDRALRDRIGINEFERIDLIEKIIRHISLDYDIEDEVEANFLEDFQRFNPIKYEKIMKEEGEDGFWEDYCETRNKLLNSVMEELFNYMKNGESKVRIRAMSVFLGALTASSGLVGDVRLEHGYHVESEANQRKYWDFFIDAMSDGDENIRKEAIKIVKNFWNSNKIPRLYYLLENENLQIRRGAREALVDMIGERHNEDIDYSGMGVPEWWRLAQYDECFDYCAYLEHIIDAAGQEDDDIRERIAREIENFEEPCYSEIFVKKLSSPNEWIREFSARELRYQDFWKNGQFDEAVDALIKALEDSSPKVRHEAAETLGELGDRRAVEPLTQVLKDKDKQVQEAAQEALQKIDAKKTEN